MRKPAPRKPRIAIAPTASLAQITGGDPKAPPPPPPPPHWPLGNKPMPDDWLAPVSP